MRTSIKRKINRIGMGALSTGLPFLILGMILLRIDSPIHIESLESKTISGEPVFNRIRWLPGWKQDVWMMQQSHRGLGDGFDQWDRLAIVVDKTTFPRTARYYQFEPGNLSWNSKALARPFRAACFMCHSNGPRVVRPNLDSPQIKISTLNQARLFIWALRIKTYGRVVADPVHDVLGENKTLITTRRPTPFRYPGKYENEPLTLSACNKCHNESWWGRGSLTRQNLLAIGFMVKHGFMPPSGFHLNESEKKALNYETAGL